MKTFIFILLLSCITSTAHAEDTAKKSFETLAQSVVKEDAATARSYFTRNSIALFDRFTGYGLLPCAPKDAAYISETPLAGGALIRSSLTDLGGKQRVMNLVFLQEDMMWKLDLPATLKRSMGEKWENQVHLTEQLYLLMKAQMGDRFQCSTLKELMKTE